MVFPVESEDRTMRNLLMLIQDNSRLLVEAFRTILDYTDALAEDEDLHNDSMEKIEQIMDESDKLKNTLIQEVQDIGGVLTNREDFFRLISTFGDIMDHIEIANIRLAEITKQNWDIPEDVRRGISEIANISFKSLTQLRDAIMSLSFNSQKSVRFTKMIDETERDVDSMYVKVDLQIINSGAPLPVVLLNRDIVSLFESMVDFVRTASDLIRIIGI